MAILHGFLSSSNQWMHNLAALGEVCRPVTIDLWGHGDSPAPQESFHYTPQGYINALQYIRQELGVQKWFMCGYSIGAGLTIRYTHTYPQHVYAHIFTNSSSGFADTKRLAEWQKDAEASAQRIRDNGIKAIERIAVHPKFAKRLPTDIYQTLVTDAKQLQPAAIANAILNTNPNASIRDIAASNPRPALCCFGAFEKRFSPYKDWLEDNMQDVTVASLQAGHAVNMEDIEGFNRAATQFITLHT